MGNWFADCDAWDDAYDWWKVAARRGNAAAQYDVARAYDEGCYDIEHEEAVKWYRMAAAQGHAKAEDNLCEICFFWNHTDLVPLSEAMGYCLRGEMRDSERARDFRARHWWWLRDRKRDVAASPGSRDSAAQYRLAQSLHHARRDVVAAVPHYRRAARLGSADAQYQLAKISLDHKGRIVEPREAMDWVSLAMEQGDERARRIERDVRELEADARCGYFCDDDDGSPRLSLAPTRLAARTRWRTRRRQASANIK